MNRLKKRLLPAFLQRHQWVVNMLGVLFFLTAPISFLIIFVWNGWRDILDGIDSLYCDVWDMITYKWEE